MARSKNVRMKAAYLAAGVLPVLLGGCSWGSKPAGPPVTVVPKGRVLSANSPTECSPKGPDHG